MIIYMGDFRVGSKIELENEKCAIMSRIIISLGSIQQQAAKPETETT